MLHFITFGGGTKCYNEAVSRITSQIKASTLFDTVTGYLDTDLKSDLEFWNKHGSFIEKSPRGYGFWLWKPYLILKKLQEVSENDFLIYADTGFEFDIIKKDDLLKLKQTVIEKKFIGMPAGCSNDMHWTKKSTSDYFNLSTSVLQSVHIQAGLLYMQNCKALRDFIFRWYSIGSNNYAMIDDSPSTVPDYNGFRDHRHDQSILSCLSKSVGWYNTQFIIDNKSPFILARNRTGVSILNK
jgi:hypothetical protein